MVAHLNEWLEQCDTLHTSHVMTDDEIIQSVLQPHGEDTLELEDEVQDVGDRLGETGHIGGDGAEITVLGMAEEIPPEPTRKCPADELLKQLDWALNQLSIRDWFSDKDSAVIAALIEKASREGYESKKQTKLTKYFNLKH